MRHRNLLQTSVNLRHLVVVISFRLIYYSFPQNYITDTMAEGIDRRADGEKTWTFRLMFLD